MAAGKLRSRIDGLAIPDLSGLQDDPLLRRAMLILSFLGHAYVWGEPEAASRMPAPLAIPWYEVSTRLGRPPVLSYASYALDNWRRLERDRPIELGNIVLLQNFLGGLDEESFILVHVAIEAKTGPALAAIVSAQEAAMKDAVDELTEDLVTISNTIEAMHAILLRMTERCDPYIYFHRVRPYLHGWNNHPALPEGMAYDGVDAYRRKPQRFRGETGAQSGIVPSLDAALGISHKEDQLQAYLMEMRDYMPPRHRAFIEATERGPSIRRYVLRKRKTHSSLNDAYNACIHGLELFRSTHLEYARRYIQLQSQQGGNNPVGTGTGGTPFIPYLKKHRDETAVHRIR